MKPQNHPYFDDFVQWADNNDVDMTYEDDWLPWWECFLAGVEARESNIGDLMGEDQ